MYMLIILQKIFIFLRIRKQTIEQETWSMPLYNSVVVVDTQNV